MTGHVRISQDRTRLDKSGQEKSELVSIGPNRTAQYRNRTRPQNTGTKHCHYSPSPDIS